VSINTSGRNYTHLIPFEEAHDLAGLVTVAGLLAASVLTKLG
jgi:hypothetical protein